MNSIKKKARLAGLSYLFIILCGIFSHMVVRASLIVSGDASKTAANILANVFKFRLSIVSDFVMIISFLMLGLLLYQIFKETDKFLSSIMLALNIVGTGIMALNMLNQQAALLVLTGGSYLSVFDINQLHALSLFFMKLHGTGYQIATISYGIWLLPMGYLGLKSGYIPKTIAYLLMMGAIGYTVVFVSSTLGIKVPDEFTIPADLGEFSLCLFLLIKGVKQDQSSKAFIQDLQVK